MDYDAHETDETVDYLVVRSLEVEGFVKSRGYKVLVKDPFFTNLFVQKRRTLDMGKLKIPLWMSTIGRIYFTEDDSKIWLMDIYGKRNIPEMQRLENDIHHTFGASFDIKLYAKPPTPLK